MFYIHEVIIKFYTYILLRVFYDYKWCTKFYIGVSYSKLHFELIVSYMKYNCCNRYRFEIYCRFSYKNLFMF